MASTPAHLLPCSVCGRTRDEHQDSEHGYSHSAENLRRLTDSETQALIRRGTRVKAGLLEPDLPPPAERKRIRKDAGVTQKQVADALNVSRHTIAKYEKQAGWVDGERLQGREPVGEIRREYAKVLRNMERLATE